MLSLFKARAAAIATLHGIDALKQFVGVRLSFIATGLSSPASGNFAGTIVTGGIKLAQGIVIPVAAAYSDWSKEPCYDRSGKPYLGTFDDERGPVPCRRIESLWNNEPSNELECEIVPDFTGRSVKIQLFLPDGTNLGNWKGSTFVLNAADTLALMAECDKYVYAESKKAPVGATTAKASA